MMRQAAKCAMMATLLAAVAARETAAQVPTPAIMKEVGIDQQLNHQVPLDLVFRDSDGRQATLGEHLGQKPTILVLAYYQCPMLCTQVLNAMTRSASALPWAAGQQYRIVVVSIDPTEDIHLAAAKKRAYLSLYTYRDAADGWRFLTGDQENIAKLAEAVGFRYRYDEASKQYAHASGIMVLTPEGKLSRYFYGIDYPTRDLRLALVEASEGKIGSPVDQFLLLCFHYDPMTGRYGLAIMNLLRATGAATVVALGTFIAVNLRRERRARRKALQAVADAPEEQPR